MSETHGAATDFTAEDAASIVGLSLVQAGGSVCFTLTPSLAAEREGAIPVVKSSSRETFVISFLTGWPPLLFV